MFGDLHAVGFTVWHPDVINGTASSLYNSALEGIALSTFEQAAVSLAYQHLEPNLKHLSDTALIERLFRNFVWGYMRKIILKEQKNPGTQQHNIDENKAYKNQKEVTTRRFKYLYQNGWNERVQLLAVDVECTSDQEDNPGGGFYIMPKPARNPHITDFLRTVDELRIKKPLFRRQRKKTFTEESRVLHPDPAHRSCISECVPLCCPLDWFKANFFNSMDLASRAKFVDAPICLPLQATDIVQIPNPDWKTMDEAEFMEKYGNDVQARYNLPTEEEIERLNDMEGEGSD
ncbi:hypothetical protein DXG01_005900 [Tephrocybe rancida]|nr:hypothetical protein DXG01_005900 [Tephrocybe rancida]